MTIRAIRGAITVESNTAECIEAATIELLTEIYNKNKVETENISHAIFTLTEDLNAAFPAKFAREKFNWENVPMMCFNELPVPNSLPQCLRIMIVLNSQLTQKEINHIYLKGAKKLRPDLIDKN